LLYVCKTSAQPAKEAFLFMISGLTMQDSTGHHKSSCSTLSSETTSPNGKVSEEETNHLTDTLQAAALSLSKIVTQELPVRTNG
jgi:hypothetical protein